MFGIYAIDFWGVLMSVLSIIEILCALFGMVKWPFERLGDLQRSEMKRSQGQLPSDGSPATAAAAAAAAAAAGSKGLDKAMSRL